ncbi:cell division control protein 14, SIN component-domain-containing protein [Mycena rebaudengoi]|nr:cell division control protein 14, SIN component-domain-containing protein [Mycena rebaudengoi]KAJ7248401.1 cell division control protein 14, SIN component-domain-containing protein [Mycena rebaudengoi]
MEDRLLCIRAALQDALDDLLSPRTSGELKTEALRIIEGLLASACVPKHSTDDLDCFLALQHTFECNVPSRMLSWVASATLQLEILTNKAAVNPELDPEVTTLTSQLSVALSIVQGICLNHPPTKTYLGRKYSLEVLLDLFLASRHLSSTPFESSASTDTPGSPVKPTPGAALPLASVILDTLLCILVDSSPALRVFEDCNGVQAVVKILKRAGTPREVRMKCLEFLYFYLLDETASSSKHAAGIAQLIPTAPSTPIQSPAKKPSINGTPAHPISRYGSSTFSLTSSSFVSSSFSSSSSSSSRSTSGSSFSSTSSNASSVAPSTMGSTSPKKQTQFLPPAGTPKLQPRSLMMLRRDVDFVPVSPKKAVVVGEDGRALGKARGVARTRSRLASDGDDGDNFRTTVSQEDDDGVRGGEREARTTEEKKKLLGTMLGNVEALVEGVRKAGVWGLG